MIMMTTNGDDNDNDNDNDRLNGFGFLGGKQVKEAGIGNLGLQDRTLGSLLVDFFFTIFFYHLERLALHWVQKHISAFGGDPTKVTLYGLFPSLRPDVSD